MALGNKNSTYYCDHLGNHGCSAADWGFYELEEATFGVRSILGTLATLLGFQATLNLKTSF